MGASHAMLMAKRPLFRKVYFWSWGVITVLAGVGIAYTAITDYVASRQLYCLPAIPLGIALPFIIVGGEKFRLWRAGKKIRCVRCEECSSEFPLKSIYKTGRCPECSSRRLVGIMHDGNTV